jgi:hypothetical protein
MVLLLAKMYVFYLVNCCDFYLIWVDGIEYES